MLLSLLYKCVPWISSGRMKDVTVWKSSKKERDFAGPALGSLADCCPPTYFDCVSFVAAGILSRPTGFLIADKIFRDVRRM